MRQRENDATNFYQSISFFWKMPPEGYFEILPEVIENPNDDGTFGSFLTKISFEKVYPIKKFII